MASFLSTPLIAAETALAADAAFLLWCGATSAADAKANYIFSDDPKKDADLPAKYAVISEMKDGYGHCLNEDSQFTLTPRHDRLIMYPPVRQPTVPQQ